jgi:acyl-CoA dehydrogenase
MHELLITEEIEVFRQTVRMFMRKEVEPHVEEWERDRGVPRSVWNLFGEQGLLCPWVEAAYGGSGAGFEYSVVIAEELGRTRASAPMVSLHSDIIVPYIADHGTEEQKARWLPGCVTGQIVTAIAMTEPGTGSDLKAIRTRAVRDGDGWVLNGQKTFISNGLSADLVIVACRTDPEAEKAHRGMSLVVVERDAPGFSRGPKLRKMGCDAQDTADLYFDDCRVPASNLLGEENGAFRILMGKLQQERIVAAVMSQVAAEVMLEDAIGYAKERRAFGKRIGDHQHNAFKIAELATEVEMGRAFLDRLVYDHTMGRDVVRHASMAKYWICEMANRVAYHAVQLHGGAGYVEDTPICRMYRDVRVHTIYAGTSEIMKSIIARSLGLEG